MRGPHQSRCHPSPSPPHDAAGRGVGQPLQNCKRSTWFVSPGRFTPVVALGIVMQAAKNDVGFLQLIDSGLHSPYCALEKARSLLGHATQSTMEIVHVTPATIFHVRQALTVEGQLALVLLNALNYGYGRNLLLLAIIQDRDDEGEAPVKTRKFQMTHYRALRSIDSVSARPRTRQNLIES